jgi:hypothetical protein
MKHWWLALLLAGCGGIQDPVHKPDGGGASHDGAIGHSPDMAGGGGGTCGACPSGYTCGRANGIAVCRAPSGIPLFKHVFIIVMENTSLSTLQKATSAPYLQSLFAMRASSGDYHGVAHPSLPNYIAMTSGDTQAIKCDCDPTGGMCNGLICNGLIHSCGCAQSVSHIGDQLESAGLSWRAYGEDMGSACNLTSAGGYATRHVPFLYYDDVQTDQARCNDRVVDYGQLAGDLAGTTPSLVFIAPNLTDDMHDPFPASATNLANGDQWLSTAVPAILGTRAFTDAGLLLIVWDEDDLSGLLAADDPIPMILLSPLALGGGYMSTVHADHYSLLATVEDGLGVPRLGQAAAATPLADFFPAN